MILVTGGTGLVGAHLLVALTKTEAVVRATRRADSDLKKVAQVFSYYSDDYTKQFQKIEWVVADINDIPALELAFEGITQVYHCAALISFNPKDYSKLLKINAEGTANMVNLCLAFKIKKLVYVSSIATTGKELHSDIVNEESEWTNKDANVYALTKYEAEMEVWRGSQEGLPVVIFNPGVILGPGFWNSGSGLFFKSAAKEYSYYPPGGTGFITVNDVVKLLILGMNSTIDKERFIAISENKTYKEILHAICENLKIASPTKELKLWQLQLLRRLDWIRSVLTSKQRKITGNTVKSLSENKVYDNKKLVETFNYEFQALDKTIAFSCRKFKEES